MDSNQRYRWGCPPLSLPTAIICHLFLTFYKYTLLFFYNKIMSEKNADINKAIAKILSDIRVELLERFDKNFEDKSYFGQAWKRKRPGGYRSNKPLLIDTGDLRRSVKGETTSNSVIFTSSSPYASIHNHGGEITVTRKMKAYFWHKYKEAIGGFGYTRGGVKRDDARNRAITSEAAFYRAMALQRVGSKIRIPRRKFLGYHPEVEKAVREIVEENLRDFLDDYDFNVR